MLARSNKKYSFLLIVADFIVLTLGFMLAYVIRVQIDNRPLLNEVYALEYVTTFLTVIPLWIIVFASLGLYSNTVRTKRVSEIGKLFIGSVIGILIVLGYSYVIDEPIFPARLVAVYAFVFSFVFLVFSRTLIHTIYGWLLRHGRGGRRVLVIGNSKTTCDIIMQLHNAKHSGYEIIATAGPKTIIPKNINVNHYSLVEKSLSEIRMLQIDTIIQTDLFENSERNQNILAAAQSNHIEYCFIPGEAEFYSGKNTVDVFLGYPMITVSQTPLVGWGAITKSIFDALLSTLFIAILSPLLLLLMIFQKVFNPGPIFYKSKRLSRYSEEIMLYKFRSMRPEFGAKDAADEFQAMGREDLAKEYEVNRKVKNDPRITWFGKFLRNTSLDELPQFFNVFKGDLSLVGPRPILPQEMKFIKHRGALLHSVKSGVTGLWQVSGRNDLSFDKRIELEMYYAQNWSFWLDIKILFKTIGVVLKRKGAK